MYKLILILIEINYTFRIQERSTMKFVSTYPEGKIKLVDMIQEASIYKLIPYDTASIDMFIIDEGTGKVMSSGHDKHFMLFDDLKREPNQMFQLNLDKEGYYQISQGNDLFVFYDSFTNGLTIGEFNSRKNIGYSLFLDVDALPYPPDYMTDGLSKYRKYRKEGKDEANYKDYLDGLFGNQAAEGWTESKYFGSEKLAQHDWSHDDRMNHADVAAQGHNASAKDFADATENAGALHARGHGGIMDVNKSDNYLNHYEVFPTKHSNDNTGMIPLVYKDMPNKNGIWEENRDLPKEKLKRDYLNK